MEPDKKIPKIDETYYDRLKKLDTKEIEAPSLALLDMKTIGNNDASL